MAAEFGLSKTVPLPSQASIAEKRTHEIGSDGDFRAFIDAAPESVTIITSDGILVFANQPGLEILGSSALADVRGKNFYDFIAPEHRDVFRQFNESVCGGKKASLRFDVIDLMGSLKHVESHAAPLRRKNGTTAHLAITRTITERKQLEQTALLLGAIVDSSDDAIISKDLNGVITSWNKAAERLFGYTAKEAVGQSITILIPPDRMDEEPNILARLRRGEVVDHFETVRRRKDGALLDISLTISPVKDSEGTIIGASKIARDISDRKRSQRAIQTLNEQLTADLAAMSRMQQLSIRLIQVDDFAQLLNEIMAASIETTRADMGSIQLLEDGILKTAAQNGFQAPFLDFFKSDQTQAAASRVMERGKRVIIEDVAGHPVFAGTPALPVMLGAGIRALQLTPLVTRLGQVLGVLSTYYRKPLRPSERDLRLLDILARQAADLIERKRAEVALVASESRFRQLADAMPQIVWTARPDGYIDYYNERWYQFTGFARSIFGDLSWERILHRDDVERCRETWYASVQSGEPFRIEYRFWDRHDERWRWFMGRALAVRDTRGEIVKWFGSSTDIEDQKHVEDELRRANQDLEQFAYSASHDLQEPLRSVKIYSELLADRYGDTLTGEALEFLRFLRGGASRMEMLITDLLSYTQVARLESPSDLTDANLVLEGVLANLAGAISKTEARVTAEPLPSLHIPAAHLQQLFQNLLSNAIKYYNAGRKPEVHVSAERQSGQWLFSITDNGIGIAPEHKERIFGLFKRLHSSDEYSGTGIGLAICQRIVERYHGRIWVESKPGEGSTFRFTLPI